MVVCTNGLVRAHSFLSHRYLFFFRRPELIKTFQPAVQHPIPFRLGSLIMDSTNLFSCQRKGLSSLGDYGHGSLRRLSGPIQAMSYELAGWGCCVPTSTERARRLPSRSEPSWRGGAAVRMPGIIGILGAQLFSGVLAPFFGLA